MTDTPIYHDPNGEPNPDLPADTTPEPDLLHIAWGIIANARDWLLDDKQAHEWVEAAKRWRDDYHKTLQASDG